MHAFVQITFPTSFAFLGTLVALSFFAYVPLNSII